MLIFQMLKIVILIGILAFISVSITELIYLYLLIFINSLFDGFTNPIKNSFIPYIEKEEHILSANAKMNTMNNVVQVGSWALGGILLAALGYSNLIILTIVLYIFAVIFTLFIKDDKQVETEAETMMGSFHNMIKTNLKTPWSRFLNISTFIESFAHSVWIAAVILIYVETFLQVDTFWFGMINATFFTGMIIAGLVVNFQDQFFQKRFSFFIFYLPIVLAVLNMSFAINHILIFVLLCSCIYGILDEMRTTVLHSKLQSELNDTQITDTYVLNNMVYSFSFAISTYLITVIVDYSGVFWAFIIAGLAYLVVFIVGLKYQHSLTQHNEQI
ncbi:MFS transporter [Staphylococcus auricularis]|uniref:MFS transporter n=1 Tax=Staphylococcus auricularis TaxID=29379 RepID=UPI001E34F2A4|nr:MFS transporter [Staphylococcus auricularis]